MATRKSAEQASNKPANDAKSPPHPLTPSPDPAAEAPTVSQAANEQGLAEAAPEQEAERGRQTAAPTCPYHKTPTKAGHSNPFFTYYYCQVPHCAFSVKQARPNLPRRLHEAHEQQDHSAR